MPPPGFDLASIKPDPAAREVTLVLSQQGGTLRAAPLATGAGPALPDDTAPASPVAWLISRNRWLSVKPPPDLAPEPPPPKALAWCLPAGEGARIALPEAAGLVLGTDHGSLTLRQMARPAWASAMGRDHHGLWVECRLSPARGAAQPVTQRLRWCPPGRFAMGSLLDEPGRYDQEGPRHSVCISKGFWLFDTPCTQALWLVVMGENPSQFQDPGRPVEQVDWDQAQGFIERINQRVPGLGLSLPSEAQWEHACRAGSESALYSGPIEIVGERNAPALDPIAWYGGNSCEGFELTNGYGSADWSEKQYPSSPSGTHPVGLKQPNAWGLYDMLGNVWEWTADHWHDSYEGAPTDGRPWLDAGVGAGARRAVRGGSWIDGARFCRCAVRSVWQPDFRNFNQGFRCARVQEA